MLRDLRRYLALGRPVDIVYLRRDGVMTQRRVKLLFVGDTHILGYCYSRRAVRQFAIANVLAVFPAKAAGRMNPVRRAQGCGG